MPPSRPTKRVFVVLFQFGECCNCVGVFATRAAAVREVRNHGLAAVLAAGLGEYPNEWKRWQDLALEECELRVRDPFDGEEMWFDLVRTADNELIQPALFTVVREEVQGAAQGAGRSGGALPVRVVHPAPEATQ